jgi:hypothetical protein
LFVVSPSILEKRPALAMPGVLVKVNKMTKKKETFVVKGLFVNTILAIGLFEEYWPSFAFVVWFSIK